MFCKICGAQIDDNSVFCMKCGGKVQENLPISSPQPAQSSIQNQMSLRQESINELNRIYDYFAKKQNSYNEYDYLQEQIQDNSEYTKGFLIIGLVILGIGVCLFPYVMEFLVDTIKHWSKNDIVDNTILSVLIGLMCLPILIGILLIRKNKKKNRKREMRIEALSDQLNNVVNELTKYYQDFGPCVIGAEYSNPKIINVIRGVITQGRADTPKEAINVMLDDMHKTHMQIQADLQTKALKSIKRSSAITAGASVATAAFCGADLVGGFVDGIT